MPLWSSPTGCWNDFDGGEGELRNVKPKRKARYISTVARDEMSADAMTLAFDASINLGRRAVIDAIAATLDSLGDPLDRLWIEDTSARRRTYTVEGARAVLGPQPGFRYLWAVPVSERRNIRSNWLTAVMVDSIAVKRSLLFFALPQGFVREFAPHVTLLELLVHAGVIPQYGWAYSCQYDKPDYFAFDYAYNNRVGNSMEPPAGGGRAGGMILDVFPMNVLSDIHLRQKIGDTSLQEWIVQNTGANSLTQIAPGCFIWRVPAAQTAAIAARLEQSGMTIREHVTTVSRDGPPKIGTATSVSSSPLDRHRRSVSPVLRSPPAHFTRSRP